MTAMISGSRARRQAMIWRGAAVGVGVFAAGLWAVQIPLASREVRLPEPSAAPAGASTAGGVETEAPPLDPQTIADAAERLNTVLGRVTKVTTTDPQNPEPTQPTPGIAGWKYLGSIIEPRRKVAIVSVDGKQAALAEGREFNGIRIVEVKPGGLVVHDGTRPLEMTKEAKSGSSVAWVAPGGGGSGIASMGAALNAAGMNTNVVTNGMAAGTATQTAPGMEGYSPEQLAQLRERGIDPEQAARMRQRLQQQRERGRMSPAKDSTMTEDGSVRSPAKNNQGAGDATQGAGPDAPAA